MNFFLPLQMTETENQIYHFYSRIFRNCFIGMIVGKYFLNPFLARRHQIARSIANICCW